MAFRQMLIKKIKQHAEALAFPRPGDRLRNLLLLRAVTVGLNDQTSSNPVCRLQAEIRSHHVQAEVYPGRASG